MPVRALVSRIRHAAGGPRILRPQHFSSARWAGLGSNQCIFGHGSSLLMDCPPFRRRPLPLARAFPSRRRALFGGNCEAWYRVAVELRHANSRGGAVSSAWLLRGIPGGYRRFDVLTVLGSQRRRVVTGVGGRGAGSVVAMITSSEHQQILIPDHRAAAQFWGLRGSCRFRVPSASWERSHASAARPVSLLDYEIVVAWSRMSGTPRAHGAA